MYDITHPADGGMFYKETNLHHFFPEPWNMVTSILFLVPGIYWLIKLKGFSRQYAFLSSANWLMLIGCIGGSIYHGLRRWRVFLFMDWVPIALLCLMASIYFWIKLTGKWFYGLIAFVVFLAIEGGTRFLISGTTNIQLAISLNYSVMVLMILLPLILLLIKTRWENWQTVALALTSFVIAISFRVYDHLTTLSIGTHFLWHAFGVIATALMFRYLYRLTNSARTR